MDEKAERCRGKAEKKRILIVDDHPIVRMGLTELINNEADLVVCGEAEGAIEALEVMEKECVDLAIVDISLDGMTGIQLTEKIKVLYPGLPVLILSMHDEVLYARRAFRAGARGYVVKRAVADNIINAIRDVLGGAIHICVKMTAKIKLAGFEIDQICQVQ